MRVHPYTQPRPWEPVKIPVALPPTVGSGSPAADSERPALQVTLTPAATGGNGGTPGTAAILSTLPVATATSQGLRRGGARPAAAPPVDSWKQPSVQVSFSPTARVLDLLQQAGEAPTAEAGEWARRLDTLAREPGLDPQLARLARQTADRLAGSPLFSPTPPPPSRPGGPEAAVLAEPLSPEEAVSEPEQSPHPPVSEGTEGAEEEEPPEPGPASSGTSPAAPPEQEPTGGRRQRDLAFLTRLTGLSPNYRPLTPPDQVERPE